MEKGREPSAKAETQVLKAQSPWRVSPARICKIRCGFLAFETTSYFEENVPLQKLGGGDF
jgi:hypothetical protein